MEWLRRRTVIYAAFAATMAKVFMAYSVWFWAGTVVSATRLFMMVYFWRALYHSKPLIGGMGPEQVVNYVIWAQILAALTFDSNIGGFSHLLRQGQIGVELLRPVDMQLRFYVEALAGMAVGFMRQVLLLAVVAWLFLGLQVPRDPAVWGVSLLVLLLGYTVLFLFDWAYSSLAFYTTETWGLHVLREGVATFFSGALLPLTMLPDWLRSVASAMPFAQGLYAPVGLFTGVIPLTAAPRVLLGQALWVFGLLLFSRFAFARAVRVVTVQGG